MEKIFYNLTTPQKSIFLTEMFYKNTSINHICGTATIKNKLDFDLLKKAICILIENNDSFHLKFSLNNNEMVQSLDDPNFDNIDIVDVSNLEEVCELEKRSIDFNFSIEDSVLYKFTIFRLPDGSGGFIADVHHILSDSWTLGIIAKEIVRIYSCLLKGEEVVKNDAFSYLSYINDEKEYMESSKFDSDRAYWKEVFKTVPEQASIPATLKSSDSSFSCKANRRSFEIDHATLDKINAWCKEFHVSVFNFFMAVYSVYIGRVSNLTDFVIGTPILNRSNFNQKNTTGMFINTAPLRINIDNDISFSSFVSNIAKDSLSMLRHQKYHYQTILEDLRADNVALPNLYNVLISYQVTRAVAEGDISYETRWNFNGNVADDINIHLYDLNDEGMLNIAYDYKISKYNNRDIEVVHNRVLHIINQILAKTDIYLKDILVVTSSEKYNILYNFNNTDVEYDFNKNIIQLIEDVAHSYPKKIAIEDDTESITYLELIDRVCKLSNYLINTSHIQPNSNIGIFTSRNIDTIVGILAILKINCTYVPIDPEYPNDRIEYMIEQSNIDTILYTDSSCKNCFINNTLNFIQITYSFYYNNSTKIDFSFNYDINSNLYIVFTSGSTGNPKGVTISHKNIMNLIFFEKNKTSIFDEIGTNKILQFATMSFDVSYQEIFSALLTASTLVLVRDDIRKNADALLNYIMKKQINTLFIPPAYLRILTENSNFVKELASCLKNVITAGEALVITNGINQLLNLGVKVHNHYGPAETHVATTYTLSNPVNSTSVPIGRPISNTNIYILDNNNSLCPINVVGQIAISGDCVGNGYFNRTDLTHEKFILDPFNRKNKMYLTGDLGFWDETGVLHYVGRMDFQVKINGFRIEPSEIDKVFMDYPNIKNSISIVTEHLNKKYIVTYYTSNEEFKNSSIIDYLKSKLPKYMIPSKIMYLKSFPLTPNGKIDKKSLPKVNFLEQSCKFVPPTNETQKKLTKLFEDIFHSNEIGIYTDFFSIGGDSLLAIKLASEIKGIFDVDVSVSDIYTNSNVASLAILIDRKSKSERFIVTKQNLTDYYPLSSGQKRIYFANKLAPNSTLYNMCGGILVNCILDKDKVDLVIKKLLALHSSFRTCFKIVENEPKQFVLEHIDLDIECNYSQKSNLQNILDAFPKPFDLAIAPLLHVSMYILDNKQTLLLIDSHHIILDGVSLQIFISDFCKLYDGEIVNPQLIEYKDYSVCENNFYESDKIENLKHYWSNIFKDTEIPVLNLPYDYSVSQLKTYNGDIVVKQISKNLFENLETLARNYNVSTYMLFLSAFVILLYQYSGQCDMIIGSPIAARDEKELQDIIGMFVNIMPLRFKINSHCSLQDLLDMIKNTVLDGLSNQPYPYDKILKDLSFGNNLSLFDVMFTYQNMAKEEFSINNCNVNILYSNTHTSKYNLSMEIIPNTYTLRLEYNTDLFRKETIENFLEHYLLILNEFLLNRFSNIDEFCILTKSEEKLLNSFNNTCEEINDDTFVSIFERQVSLHPNDIALICNNKSLTYYELNQKANSLAHMLIKYGISSNDTVCIMTNRSFETIVCMLAILKSGAAFFNVDPTYPVERTKYYIEDSKTKYVLTQKELKDKVSTIENCIEIDLNNEDIYSEPKDNPNVLIKPNDLSYIIYTSGSTGTPKGVMLNHVGLSNMVKAMYKVLNYLKEGNKHAIASVTSTPFDIFVYEIVVSLAYGLRVVMATNSEHRNPKLLDDLIKKHNIDVMTVTPSLMKINYDNREPQSALANVKNMVFGGEPLPEKFVNDLRALSDDITIYNIYGPSEITVLSNVQNLDGESEITVGPPIMNTQIHILDKNMNRVPIGVVGEIYISGIQVGLGYIGKPEMTASKFLDNPFGEGKIYKSGDIGRWTFDGKVQCLGRVDNQIKLRGLRIELGEIENKINEINGISASIVNKIEIDGKEVLCGYYVANDNISENSVRDVLRNSLPPYMIPSYFVRLDAMPYTINRKIDRKALPLPELNKNISDNKINIKELSTNEEKLLQIWKNILKIDDININDNFFDIGGDSVSAISMQIEALKYGLDFEYSDIFRCPTIHDLSNIIINNTPSFINNYDYSNINNVLEKSILDNLDSIKDVNVNNILLIGSTGFLGIHIVHAFLKNEKGKIYCLIRPKDGIEPEERLKDKINFYFGKNYWEQHKNRICIIKGDIIQNNLGLSISDYNLVCNNINVIVNSGALVKHFGKSKLFEDINVIGTQNIVNLCINENKRLIHISTTSVSGNGEKEETVVETPENINNKKIFKETSLFIDQNINGVYTTTKYKAELIVLESINNGLDAQILRVGNITNRYSDGVFQQNVDENAFAKRLKSFIDIGAFPRYLLPHSIELTPVDLCAEAIIKILQHNSICNVFHIYNTKLLPIRLLIDTFYEVGFEVVPLSNRLLADVITGILDDNSRKNILSGIIHDLDKNKNLIYTSNIRLNSDFTEAYLNKIGFFWPDINKDYIIRYMNYFKKIGFIDEKKEEI